jgi:hypothetical protein
MRRKQKAVITVETHRLTVLRKQRPSVFAWCEQCGREVEMFTCEAAAALLGVKLREVYRRVEKGSLHFLENEDGSVLICCAPESRRR